MCTLQLCRRTRGLLAGFKMPEFKVLSLLPAFLSQLLFFVNRSWHVQLFWLNRARGISLLVFSYIRCMGTEMLRHQEFVNAAAAEAGMIDRSRGISNQLFLIVDAFAALFGLNIHLVSLALSYSRFLVTLRLGWHVGFESCGRPLFLGLNNFK